jgi:hypothetical protein
MESSCENCGRDGDLVVVDELVVEHFDGLVAEDLDSLTLCRFCSRAFRNDSVADLRFDIG